MAEEASRPKYDSLPGIDSAPDVYETPDLTEDASTVQASTAVSESEGDDSDPERSAIHHQRFQTEQARSRFQPSRVDAHGVNFSDNIAQRGSYRTSTRSQRRPGDTLGEDSDEEEEEESFSKKLLRVKRELLELEAEHQQRVESGDKSKIEGQDPKEMMEVIGDTLDEIYTERAGGARGAEARLDRTIKKFNDYTPFAPSPRVSQVSANQPPLPGTQIQRNQLEHVLNQAADFDKRITQLENNLGLNGNTMPEMSEKSTFPVFTTLQRLDQTISLIGDASTNNLEAATQNIKKLTAEAAQLMEAQQEVSRTGSASDGGKTVTSPDQEAKINALYGTLPSIDKLSPILPLVLDRLRSLRLVHTSAWQANEALSELEHRQSQQEDEIKKWETSLEIVERDMVDCEKAMHGNMKVMAGDIKMMEEKIEKLLASGQGE
jgi:nuclear migration protein JNM1